MIYTIKLKTRNNTLNDGGAETIKVEADDVDLISGSNGDGNEIPYDYNFTLANEKFVARIPFENVIYIARL